MQPSFSRSSYLQLLTSRNPSITHESSFHAIDDLFQRLKGFGSNTLINAVDQIEIPRLAVSGSGLLDALHASIVISLRSWAGLDAVLAELGEVIDRFFVVRLFSCKRMYMYEWKYSNMPRGNPLPFNRSPFQEPAISR